MILIVVSYVCDLSNNSCMVHHCSKCHGKSAWIYNLEQMEVFKKMMMCLNNGNQLTEPDWTHTSGRWVYWTSCFQNWSSHCSLYFQNSGPIF